MKKFLRALVCVLCVGLCAFVFAACEDKNVDDGSGVVVPEGAKTYSIEAEYLNLENLVSASHSGTVSGDELVYGDGNDADKAKGWSNGYYLGPTYNAGFTLNFEFTADDAANATIVLRLASELGTLALTPAVFGVKINDTEVNYQSLSVASSSSMTTMSFSDKQVAKDVKLIKGLNKVSIEIKDNDFFNGKTGGPMIDCLKVITTATIDYTIIDNPSQRGQA